MTILAKHWPALAVFGALLLALLAAQAAIFNTPPIPAAELDMRLAKLQDARNQSALARQAELQAARATVGDRK